MVLSLMDLFAHGLIIQFVYSHWVFSASEKNSILNKFGLPEKH